MFPKDVQVFIHICEKLGHPFDLLKDVRRINERQKSVFNGKIDKHLRRVKGKTIGVLGLSFKPNTDDIRNAPSLDIIKSLVRKKAFIKVYDPKAMEKSREVLYNPKAMEKSKKTLKKNITFCKDAYDAAKGSDCLAILTEWNEFKKLDFKRLKRLLRKPIIIDGRNMYDPKLMKKLGFTYEGMGRKVS